MGTFHYLPDQDQALNQTVLQLKMFEASLDVLVVHVHVQVRTISSSVSSLKVKTLLV